ncbi:fused MFS/spermidine synthase [Oceanobacillus senegalensis]|uniref:fused MFS/spermidine synthase n=1 Tax=Oceanobacillus senegalensis TaxID=1936063 RepID=UPI000A311C56|nr:fused MFS/spermidine synthase [Oceanobacillus senegalensis]
MNIAANKQKQIILLLSFLSGLSVLVYEIVWQRYLQLIFGSSVYAISTVLACFMVGFALGSWLIGKWTDKTTSSMKVFIYLEIGIGIFGFLSPFLFSQLMELHTLLFQHLEVSQPTKHIIRIVLSFIIIIFPAILMGGTLPPLVKIYHEKKQQIGKDAANVYAINTLGGVIGAFLTGFFLIHIFGLQKTIFLASLSDIVVAVIAFLLYKKGLVQNSPMKKTVKNVKKKQKSIYPKQVISLVLMVYAISGFSSLSFEVYWTKILTLFFRDSIYDFTIVLSGFLTGIVIGSYICGKFIKKMRNPIFIFASLMIVNGLITLLCLFFIHQLPYLTNYLQSMNALYDKYGDSYWIMSIVIKYGYSFLVMLLPTSLFGAIFPIVSQICVKNQQEIGGKIGYIQTLNTLGSTLGSLLSGFVFISFIGIHQSMILTSILIFSIGLALFVYTPWKSNKLKTYVIAISIIGIILVISIVPAWDKLRMSTSFLEPNQEIEKALDLHYYHEDAFGITSVVEFTPWDQKYLVTNRIYTQNTSDLMGLEDHRRLGHIPLLLMENPNDVLIIGLGAGITTSGVSEHNVDSIDVVEISEGVKNAAKYFSEENKDILNDANINFIIEDGRNYLSTTQKKYDVIISDIIFPMSSGSSSMFSKEYYDFAKKRLSNNGMMVQWLPIHQMSMEEIKIITRTFQTVYPSTSIWYGMLGDSVPVVGLFGQKEKLQINIRMIEQKFSDPDLIRNLEEIGLGNPYFLLENFIMEGHSVNQFTKNQPINTDEYPILEFSNPKLYGDLGRQNLKTFERLREDITPYIKE